MIRASHCNFTAPVVNEIRSLVRGYYDFLISTRDRLYYRSGSKAKTNACLVVAATLLLFDLNTRAKLARSYRRGQPHRWETSMRGPLSLSALSLDWSTNYEPSITREGDDSERFIHACKVLYLVCPSASCKTGTVGCEEFCCHFVCNGKRAPAAGSTTAVPSEKAWLAKDKKRLAKDYPAYAETWKPPLRNVDHYRRNQHEIVYPRPVPNEHRLA